MLSRDKSFDLARFGNVQVSLHLPDAAAGPLPLLVLIPGGSDARNVFDAVVDGDDSFSMARWVTNRGLAVLTFDNLGTGASESAVMHPTRTDAEAAADLVVRRAAGELRSGEFDEQIPPLELSVVVGSGHSLGGHVLVGAQAAHRTFDAIAPMGASMAGTTLTLKAGATRPFRAAPPAEALMGAGADVDWRANNYWSDVPDRVIDAVEGTDVPAPWRTNSLAFAAELTQPYASAFQAAAVRVPVLLIYGQRDVTVEPLADVATVRSAPSVSLCIIPRMAHGMNFASSRAMAWLRLCLFVDEVVELGRIGYPNRPEEREAAGHSEGGGGRYNLTSTPLRVLLEDPEAVAILDATTPGLSSEPSLRMATALSVGDVLDLMTPVLGDPAVRLLRNRLSSLY